MHFVINLIILVIIVIIIEDCLSIYLLLAFVMLQHHKNVLLCVLIGYLNSQAGLFCNLLVFPKVMKGALNLKFRINIQLK